MLAALAHLSTLSAQVSCSLDEFLDRDEFLTDVSWYFYLTWDENSTVAREIGFLLAPMELGDEDTDG